MCFYQNSVLFFWKEFPFCVDLPLDGPENIQISHLRILVAHQQRVASANITENKIHKRHLDLSERTLKYPEKNSIKKVRDKCRTWLGITRVPDDAGWCLL